MTHPALVRGRAAVVTGAAGGIGLAAARRFAGLGMAVCLADRDTEALEAAAGALRQEGAAVLAVPTDVSRPGDLVALRDAALSRFGDIAVLMNNAGREGPGSLAASAEQWHAIIDTNLWGVIHGIQAFVPAMTEAGKPGAVITTGSKQGITTPPGNTAYNVSKAGIKVVAEALAYDLREAGAPISAHLLIPGFTFTGLTRSATKPDAAWTADQVVDRLMEGMAAGDFYILCADNAVTPELDRKRIAWAAGDIIENRPALSRWHKDWAGRFDAFVAG